MASVDRSTLPPGLFQHNGKWYYRRSRNGKRTSRALKCTSLREARIRYDEVERQFAMHSRTAIIGAHFARMLVGSKSLFSRMLTAAKARAHRKGISFTLTRDDVAKLYSECGGECAVSKLPFTLDRSNSRAPFSPSLDRIDSTKGYTYENCRIVCYVVNMAMSDYGEEPLRIVARAIASEECRVSAADGIVKWRGQIRGSQNQAIFDDAENVKNACKSLVRGAGIEPAWM